LCVPGLGPCSAYFCSVPALLAATGFLILAFCPEPLWPGRLPELHGQMYRGVGLMAILADQSAIRFAKCCCMCCCRWCLAVKGQTYRFDCNVEWAYSSLNYCHCFVGLLVRHWRPAVCSEVTEAPFELVSKIMKALGVAVLILATVSYADGDPNIEASWNADFV